MDDESMNVAEEQPQVALQSTATDEVVTQEVVASVDVDKTLYVGEFFCFVALFFLTLG